ncbi:MAG: permease [Gemmatimonadetes bacterium]|nr:permease [Gemmatimonadota bacterium]
MSLTSLWRTIARGAHGIAHETDADKDVRDEVEHYLDEAAATFVAQGMTPAAARRAARVQLGTPTVIREQVRASLWESTVTSLVTDVRYATRMLRRSPIFTTVVVLVISLGVGAVTTIFSATNAFLFKPLPRASDPDRLVGIDRIERGSQGGTQASYPYYLKVRRDNRTLGGVAAWGKTDLTISAGSTGYVVYGNLVSGNFFSVLGIQPALGRFFLPDEDATPLTHPVVVVSYDFWQARLGGDSSVIGKTIGVNGTAYTLIGVAPSGFNGIFTPIITSAWVPLMMLPRIRPAGSLESSSTPWLWMFGRLKDGISRETARQDLIAITAARVAENVEPDWMKKNDDIRLISMTGLPDDARKTMLAFTGVLLGVAFLVLLIACVNVAAMLSARAVARRHEMAIRVALGAARSRIVRQLLTESTVLFALGAMGGLIIAVFATQMLEHIPLPGNVPLRLELSPDYRVFTFALLVSLGTGIMFGLAPALHAAKLDINSRLRNDSRTGGGRKMIVSNVLVVGQLALSLVLLVSAGLLLRALDRGQSVDPRFDMAGVTTAEFKTESWGYDEDRARRFFRSLRESIESAPGVTAVAYTNRLPLQMNSSYDDIALDGAAASGDGKPRGTSVQMDFVGHGYFAVLMIPIERGRAIEPTDDERSQRVAVVNETFAKHYWTDGSALGRTFGYHGERVTVVGVARDAKYATLMEMTPPHVYFPLAQEWRSEQTLVVRTSGSPQAMSAVIQTAVRSLDPNAPRPEVVSLQKATSFVLLPQRVAALVTAVLGALGLLLATIGLYGIMSYSVSRRSREIGVRMALGARAQDVQRMVVIGGMRLAGLGVVIGLALAIGASRLFVAYLYGVSPLDLPTFAVTAGLFLCVAFVASYLPARRAAMADPLIALRAD